MFQRLEMPVKVLARSGILRGFEPDATNALRAHLEEEGIEIITPRQDKGSSLRSTCDHFSGRTRGAESSPCSISVSCIR